MIALALKTALFFVLTCGACLAQADFRFYVFDETKNDRLHYEFAQDIAVYDFESQLPRFVYYTEYRVYGIDQDEFTYTTEWYAGDLSRAAYASLLKRANALPLDGLDPKKDEKSSESFGLLKLDGEDHAVTARPDREIRKRWQKFLDRLIADHAPLAERERNTKTLEGDAIPPKDLDFATLLKNPQKFDGKRIRITGYYHYEFEGSSFAATKADIGNYEEALWLGGMSSFADPEKISEVDDVVLTVEGTFELGPGGHMGLWMGELVRVTESKTNEVEHRREPGQPAAGGGSKSEAETSPK